MTTTPVLETRDAPRGNLFRERYLAQRADHETLARELLDVAEREQRGLTDTEQADYDEHLEAIGQYTARLEQLDHAESRTTRPGSVLVTRDDATYRPDQGDFIGDLVRWHRSHDTRAAQRLEAHRAETRDLSRTDGAGGEFVPPTWLMDQYAPLARAGRVFADRCTAMTLPPATDVLNIPRITGGTTVAAQTADNTAVSETDLVSDSIPAPVRTLAGQQDLALQLLEQSPLPADRVVFADLLADYNRTLDLQCLTGTGTAGQLPGVLGLAGTNTVTYTDASPTVPELYPKGADALNRVATSRFLPAEAWIMHPRRWAWMLAALDASNRPLVVPAGAGPNNAVATVGGPAAEGAVGTWHGRPVYLDANIPTNLGTGTNEDRILVGRFSDAMLFEGVPRMRVLPEVGSGTLTVRIQVYNYVAFAPGRFPAGISIVAGTGLAAPTF